MVFPVPPLEEFRVVLVVAGEIDGAAEHVEHTSINLCALLHTVLQIHIFGILSGQL